MMCDDFADRLGAYLDQELDAAARDDMERHLRTCPACQLRRERQRLLGAAIREQLPSHRAPDLLRARVVGAIQGAHTERSATPARVARWRWTAIAASLLFAITAGYAALGPGRAVPAAGGTAHEVLSSHVRSLMPDHLTDVASTDQHNVKPWFDGRLDYSPPVYDLAPHGFPLIGGRLDYVGNRAVAVLVYQRRKHLINLFVWPAERPDERARETTRQGYHMLHWTRAGMTYWAVSDLNGDELREFAQLQQHTDSLATSREGGR
ncbi:MAG TPA: anti-sigma factor [Gemmatimonadaceae bacterium]